MIGIIIHHTCLEYKLLGNSVYLPIGYLCTGIFFLRSGFGLTCSLETKHKIDAWRRLRKLLLPYLYWYVIYVIILEFYNGNEVIDWKNIFIRLLSLSSPEGGVLWFYKVIVGLYIIVLSVFSFVYNKMIKVCSIVSVCILYVLILRYLQWDSSWTSSVLCFPLGMIMYYKYDRIKAFERKVKFKIAVINILIFVVLYVIIPQKGKLYSHHIFSCPFFSISILFGASFLSIRSRFLSYVGNNSLLFYFLEVPTIKYFCAYVPCNHIALNFVSVLSTYFLSLPYTILGRLIKKGDHQN